MDRDLSNLKEVSTGGEEKFTFFWNGPFSQWTEAFFEIEGITYNCAEQYMMAEKARLFNDDQALEAIMESKDPRQQKQLGRMVKGFSVEMWEEKALLNGEPYCCNLVYMGSLAKFTQNRDLLLKLLDTAGTTLVEASPYDAIWGIGLTESDPRAKNRDTWLGRNWLGEVLTELREDFLDE